MLTDLGSATIIVSCIISIIAWNHAEPLRHVEQDPGGHLSRLLINEPRLGGEQRSRQPAQDNVEGTVVGIPFRGKDGYYIFILKTARGRLGVKGTVPGLHVGQRLHVLGTIEEHPTYGPQMKLASFTAEEPTEKEAILAFLQSGHIEGVDRVFSQKIVDEFGARTVDVLNSVDAVKTLRQVRGIGPKRAQAIVDGWRAHHEVYVFLNEAGKLGLGSTDAMRLRRAGVDLDQLRTNPYLALEVTDDVTFEAMDAVASKVGIVGADHRRVQAAALYIMKRAHAQGHTALAVDEFDRQTSRFLDLAPEAIHIALSASPTSPVSARLVAGQRYWQTTVLRDMEQEIAHRVQDLVSVKARVTGLSPTGAIRLDETQTAAVDMALSSMVSILTGGPGTGKTTVTRQIVASFIADKKKVVLMAPTGRAAERMAKATGQPAFTIHRALGLKWAVKNGIHVYESIVTDGKSATVSADVVIVDEASMVDVVLAHALLSRISPGTRLILIGDPYQLPPVGPGTFLLDMISAGGVPCTHLMRIHRQAGDSEIPANALKIKTGESPEPGEGVDIYIGKDPGQLRKNAVSLSLMLKDEDIQVLTPVHKGLMGTIEMNRILQHALNPASHTEQGVEGRLYTFYRGDRVMQRANDYERRVFNGQTGIVEFVGGEGASLSVKFDDGASVKYTKMEAGDNLMLGYCVTVHKSQGSEYKTAIVLLPLHAERMLERHSFYTALTRARERAVIFAEEGAMERAVANIQSIQRVSLLRDRLEACFARTSKRDLERG